MSVGRDPYSEEVRREAADWFARLRGPEGDQLSSEFAEWRKADPANAEAYERLLQNWDRTAFLASTGVAQSRDLSSISRQPICWRRAAAACAALVSAIGVSAILIRTPHVLSAQELSLNVVTADKRRVLALDDDSRITIGEHSAIDLQFTSQMRRARLMRGKVKFELPRADPRPLQVQAGKASVTALTGTFEVGIEPHGVRVQSLSGKVDAGPIDRPGDAQHLDTGDDVILPTSGTEATSRSASANPLSTAGMLVFDGATVGDAASRFDRVGSGRLVIDRQLQGRRVSGAFRADDPAGFARAVAAMFGGSVRATESGAIRIAATSDQQK